MNKKMLLISIILVVLCSLSAVSADDVNGTDDSVSADGDILSVPSSVVSTSEINSTDDGVGVDSDVLSAHSSSITVYDWASLKTACTDSNQYDTIYVSGGIAPSNQISISKSVSIEGLSNSYIGGSSSSNIVNANFVPFYSTTNGLNITFKNLNFQNINVQYVSFMTKNVLIYLGGNGNYNFENCNFNNIIGAGNKQSIIWLYRGTSNIENCNFTDNTLSFGTITNCYSTSGSTVNNARMSISDCRFTNNYGSYAPGAINNCGYMDIQNTVFENNRAAYWAGAVLSYTYATTNIVNSSFKNNKAGWNGGAAYTYGILNICNSTFEGNNCTTSAGGGAIGAISSGGSIFNITVKNCNFTENRNNANGGYGGAISAMDNGYFHLYNSLFKNNYAVNGRAISVKQGTYYDNDTYNSTYENASLGHPIFAIANNIFVDSDISDVSAIAYVQEDPTYILRPELNNTFYTSYPNLASIQQSNIITDGLLGLSLNDVEIIGDGQDTPQWAMDGFDSSNSRESPYNGISNGMISWNKTYANIFDLLIDKDGNIVLERNSAVVFLDDEGNQIRSMSINPEASDFSGYFEGITLTPDNYIVLSLFCQNAFGAPYNGYISSYLPPDKYNFIWDPTKANDKDNVDLISFDEGYSFLFKNNVVYATNPNNKIVCFAIQCDEIFSPNYNQVSSFYVTNNGPEVSFVSDIPESSSIIVADNRVWAITSNGFSIYDFSTVKSISASNIIGKPVADNDGNVYYFTGDKKINVISYNDESPSISADVTGIGSNVALSSVNKALYSINLDTIYRYGFSDLAETELVNIGSKASTIMTDANGIIYVGSDDGKFYAFDDEGNQKWMVDTESTSAVKNCAMDNEGNIYFYTAENKVYAINEAPIALKNLTIEVTVPEGELTTVDNITITATLNETTDGNVTFTIGDLTKTVNITGNTAEWITTIPGGNQTITATFNGNDEFATATGSIDVEISKVDVEFEKVPEEITITLGDRISKYYDIIYNNTNVTTGSVTGYDGEKILSGNFGYLNGMGWRLRINNLNAGIHNITLAYSGDDTYNPANKTFKIFILPKITASAKIVDDKINVDVTVSPDDATGKFTVTSNNETLAEGTIENGVGSVTFDKLEPGTYEFTIVYDGDNYPANNGTVSVKIPRTSQWPSVGGNPQNSGIADATREDGVSIIWEAALNGDLRSSAIIDSFGNIYVNDGSKIYSFTSEGNLIWSGGIGSAGIALYKDELVLAPQYHNAMMIYNSTTGAAIPGNFWSASSNFAPITGPDGRIYTPTDYGYPADGQGWSGNYWISVFDETGSEWEPYGFNLFLVEVTDVGYGSQAMKASPSFDNMGYIYTNTVKGFKITNIATGTTVFSNTTINGVGRPVVDANNIAYILDATLNGIYAINVEGILWNSSVSDGIGTTLAVDNENGFLYAVNANGTLYKYDTAEGSETFVYDLGSAGVSIILDADSNVYVSTAAGDVVALSAEGDLLWTINLGSKITGQLAMSNNGIIYAVADKTLYALGFDSNINVSGENVTVFDNEIITVTISAEGNVTISFNGEDTEVPIDNGTASLDLGQLPAGTYTVSVTYDGDGVSYGPAFAETTFEILKADAEITEDIVSSVENSTLTLTLPSDATGIVLAKVDGKGYYAEIENGTAVIEIPKLAPGKYPVDITYLGDDNYNNASLVAELEVPELLDPELEVSVKDTEITVTINENATGVIIVTVGDISFVYDAEDAPISIDAGEYMDAGTYDVTVNYLGDEKFNNATATAKVTVPEVEPLDPELKVSVDGTVVTVSLDELASGYVVVSIDGDDLFFEYEGSPIVVDCADYLDSGNYTVVVFYSGDDVFASDSASVDVNVPEVEPLDPELEVSVDGTVVTVSLDELASGYVVVSVDGDSLFFEYDGSPIVVECADILDPGKYAVDVFYSGDDVFASDNASVDVTVPEVELLDPELKLNIENTTISVSINENATGDVIVTVGDISFVQSADELAPIDVSEYLTNGTYPVTVRYVGDENFTESVLIGGSVTVPSEPVIEPKDPNLKASAVNNTITVSVDKDATGNVLVDVDGQGYYAPIKNGQATVNVIGLDDGEYTATVSYVGDEAYKAANTTVAVTVPKKEDPVPEPVDPEADIEVTNTTASISLPKDATGYMLVDVDGKGYYAPVKDGKASIDLPELAPGNHTVTVTYTGDNKYKSANATETVTVDEEIETVIAEDLTKVEKSPDRFEASFTDASGKALANAEVTFTLNGVTYTRTTDASGKASIGINLDAGNYTILVTNTVTKESKEFKINVLSRFAVHNDLTKYFRNASQYVVKILDDEGNPAKAGEVVTFNINGVFYNRTSDAEGNVKLNINLNPGDYIITAEYKGCKVSNNIKVLPVLTGKDLTKKFGQPDQFEATLVDGQGKAYANQKVTFNINGVFYTRTTDSNGVAKLNINLQPGQYIITSYYNEAVTSNTVTVTA